LKSIAQAHPQRPLVAVVQWPTVERDEALADFLDQVAGAGAAAVLPVGMPLWQAPRLAAEVEARGLETVLACSPAASETLRQIAVRYCSGSIYVARGRVTGGAQQFGGIADFYHTLAGQSDLPIIAGVGVKTAQDVAEICDTPAKAAVVGSALVEHVARGGSAGEFVRRLLAH